MAKRNLYLDTIPVEEALDKYQHALQGRLQPQYEEIAVTDSLHRITKEAVYARYSSPLFNASAMDGIAVIASHTEGARETEPRLLRENEDFVVVDTGDPVRAPYDAVIMAEDIVEVDGGVTITASAASWQHIRPVGEDIVAGEMILPGRHKIRAIDVGVLLSAGITRIEVVKLPRVAIFPTGDEIVEAEDLDAGNADEMIEAGGIIESNSRMFENMVIEAGAAADRYATLVDDYDTIKKAVLDALEDHDMVIVNAGSSAGRDDYTVHVFRELGEVVVHGVAIKPGKPVILAIINGKPVIGLPGYPVSAYIGFTNFVSPLLAEMCGDTLRGTGSVDAVITRRLVSSLKHREYVRVKVGKVGRRMVAAPLARGAGAAMSLVRADGFCVIPQHSEGVEAGETVRVELYRELEEVENTVVVIGSHDLILDVMADMMPNNYRDMYLSSTHVGSMGGLMALKRGEAHVAPTHLLDEKTGEYNVAVLRHLFGSGKITLVKGVGRTQGIMVKKGNPLGIRGIKDLAAGSGVRYVNRQRGAGTRVLFDYRLRQLGIDPSAVNGYEHEAATHMAVAAAVKSDSADAGMGILSAARAMDLDFIPIADEEYDFAIPTEYMELPHIKAFLEILTGDECRTRVAALGGYTFTRTGERIEI
ncbi:MAG: molybdopterin biosynthesis protein [Anaerovoracaceae bacterium]|jgi:putative molybdopterin biosynthesis protein